MDPRIVTKTFYCLQRETMLTVSLLYETFLFAIHVFMYNIADKYLQNFKLLCNTVQINPLNMCSL